RSAPERPRGPDPALEASLPPVQDSRYGKSRTTPGRARRRPLRRRRCRRRASGARDGKESVIRAEYGGEPLRGSSAARAADYAALTWRGRVGKEPRNRRVKDGGTSHVYCAAPLAVHRTAK